MSKRAFQTLAYGFAVSALLACGTGMAEVAKKPASTDAASYTDYLVGTDKHGSRIYFASYEQLPPPWQKFLDRTVTNAGPIVPGSGRALYNDLSTLEREGLLNILTKATVTLLPNGTSIFEHFLKLKSVKQDRIFVDADSTLSGEMATASSQGMFRECSHMDALFHRHHAGQNDNREGEVAGNYKTPDRHGGLQVLERKTGKLATGEIDIDEERPGFMHMARALKHTIFHQATNPLVIRRLMEKHQKLTPPYWMETTRPPDHQKSFTVADNTRSLDLGIP